MRGRGGSAAKPDVDAWDIVDDVTDVFREAKETTRARVDATLHSMNYTMYGSYSGRVNLFFMFEQSVRIPSLFRFKGVEKAEKAWAEGVAWWNLNLNHLGDGGVKINRKT